MLEYRPKQSSPSHVSLSYLLRKTALGFYSEHSSLEMRTHLTIRKNSAALNKRN